MEDNCALDRRRERLAIQRGLNDALGAEAVAREDEVRAVVGIWHVLLCAEESREEAYIMLRDLDRQSYRN